MSLFHNPPSTPHLLPHRELPRPVDFCRVAAPHFGKAGIEHPRNKPKISLRWVSITFSWFFRVCETILTDGLGMSMFSMWHFNWCSCCFKVSSTVDISQKQSPASSQSATAYTKSTPSDGQKWQSPDFMRWWSEIPEDHGLLVLLQSNLTWWVTVGDCWWLGMMSSLFCPLAVPLSIQQKHLLVRPRLKHAPACPRNSSRKMKSTDLYNMINTINIGVSFISPHRIYTDHVWIRLMVLVGRS